MNQLSMTSKFISEDVERVFTTWNDNAPIIHPVATRKMQGAISDSLRDYSADQICDAIIKYCTVIKDPNKYWWTANGYMLAGFLTRNEGDVLTRFVSTPLEGFIKKKQSNSINYYHSLD